MNIINLLYWVAAILMFGVLVILHELGHFWAARLTGVTVEEFAVGFGPAIFSRKAKSGVKYSLRALPLGGYCRFVGETEEDGDRPDAYAKQKIWKRALISIGGPLMNILTCIVLLFVLYFAIGLPLAAEPVVDAFVPGLPAEQSGFVLGDRIVRVNGVDVETTADISAVIDGAGADPVHFVVERNGGPAEVIVTPQWTESEEPPRYMVGIQYRIVNVRLGFGTSVQSAFAMTGELSRVILDVLRDLFFKGEGLEDLAGPIGAVTAVKQQTQEGGLMNYVSLAAMISVNLGLFNLLPIPGLDGSKLIFLLVEKLRGEPLTAKVEGIVTLVGFALLIGLMGVAMYQDIARLLQ